ncbi:MAG: SRPBCC family protein [Burkholderiaceae bacterium]|nr:SRPBCC family protein [Burkholderiaceae bacterium]
MSKSTFVYTIYIRTSAERLWEALTTPQFAKQYWFGMHVQTDWKKGSPWQLLFSDGRVADTGEVVEAEPPRKLVLRWRNEWKPEFKAEGDSVCTMLLEPDNDAVKLTVTHEMQRDGSGLIQAVSGGWPQILSNLKSLLETGQPVATALHRPGA